MGSGNKSRHRNRVSVEARQECAGGALVGVAFVQCNVAYGRCHKQWWQGGREGKGLRVKGSRELPRSGHACLTQTAFCLLALATRPKGNSSNVTQKCASLCVCPCVCGCVCVGKRSPLARVFCPLFWALARRLLPCVCFARSVNCCWHFLRRALWHMPRPLARAPLPPPPPFRAWWCIAFVFVASFGLGYKCSFWL